MNLKPLKIGNLEARIPIIQGGMGVGVSLSNLSGAVAKEGGIGIISTAQIGYNEEGFYSNPIDTNLKAIKKHINLAKEKAQGGIIGVNIMVATKDYERYVKEAAKAGADIIISGAGLPIKLPELVKGFASKIAPIVSSLKAASVILKMWDKKYNTTADLLIIEGPGAGGHLGFSKEQLDNISNLNYDEEIKSIINYKNQFEEKYNKKIPVVVAGGIDNKSDIEHYLNLGADGVQVASKFVATHECDASDAYKNAYINCQKNDIEIVMSPVGMPGRAVRNAFIDNLSISKKQITKCFMCLEHCNPKEIPYCITNALINAVKGDVDNGLIFCGEKTYKINEIKSVKQVIEELIN